MAETYQHGIYIKELATILTPPVEVAAPIVCVGTSAMFNATKPANPNEPILCSSLAEYVEQFGWSGDFDKYTNEEAASAAFQLFNISPVIFINVLDTTVHSAQANKVITGLSNPVTIEEPIILNTIQITSGSGSAAVTLTADEFTARFDDDKCVITITDDDRIVNDTAQLSYKKINPAAVTGADIIGGVDPTTGKNNGLDTVEDVYSKLGLLPGSLIAPKFSATPAVAQIMASKVKHINGCFESIAFADINTAQVTKYSDAYFYKSQNNLADERLVICFPKVSLDGQQYHLSTQAACLAASVDADNDNIPFTSPSNHGLKIDSAVLSDGTPVYLSKAQANFLNGGGIVTALNFAGMQRLWGNRTSIFPASSDPKDSFIPVRRMMNFIGNTLVTTYFSKIDNATTKRLIESVVDSANIWLNSLAADGAILGGRVDFYEKDNPQNDLIDGKIVFSVAIGFAVPAETVTFKIEFDPSYYSALFS
ncbi:MAG: phage tail sheath family protein [Selenomonadaceae bacterium]|nr:phage tail sheath family protein [Selenomonadaceae bacterium]